VVFPLPPGPLIDISVFVFMGCLNLMRGSFSIIKVENLENRKTYGMPVHTLHKG